MLFTRVPLRGRLRPLARKTTTSKCEGGRKGPRFDATSGLIMPRANCAEMIALCCAVCLLAMSRSDRQYGCILRKQKKKHKDNREKTIKRRKQKEEYTRTYPYLVRGTSKDT